MVKKFRYKAVYAGRRLINDKIYHVFIRSDNNQELMFKAIRGVWLGHTYECAASQISRRPKRVDAEVIINPQWEAADELAAQRIKQSRQEKKVQAQFKAADKPTLRNAIDALEPLFSGLDLFECIRLGKLLGDLVYEKKLKSKKMSGGRMK